jgi:peptide/nickel transport system substrate-binding protein
VAAVTLAACGGSSKSSTGHNVANQTYGTLVSGTLPAVGTPSTGGTLTVGQISGETPTYIFPLISAETCSTQTFNYVSQQYVPLYYGPDGAKPAIDESQSAAEAPVYSNGDKTVTIDIKPGLKWSDGKPVDANDVIFYMDLLKAALKESSANWCQYTPGDFPDNVASYTTKGQHTVVFNLKSSVNPTWFTDNQLQDTNGGVYPLPSQDWNIATAGGPHLDYSSPANAKKIYDYLNKQGETLSTFASNPLWKVVDGPFETKDFSATNSSYDLVPNPKYSLGTKPKLSEVSYITYTSSTSMLNALESGSLDVSWLLDPSTQEGSFATLRRDGYSVFGAPSWGWYGGFINFKNTSSAFDKVVAQSYIRGVFAELVNQPGLIKGVYKGWAVPAYGPVPSAPFSPYLSAAATKNPWPYNPTKAAATLKAHGWNVKPNGLTTCAKPGTAANECGAGIPAGTPLKLVWANLPESVNATGVLESEEWASEAKKAAGIDVTFQTKTFNFLVSEYSDVSSTKNANAWGVNNYGGITSDFYPTESGVLSVGGSLNMGGYDDPQATKLMNASTTSPSTSAISNEVKYFSTSYPVFWMPDPDQVFAVSNKVGGSAKAFLTLSYQQVVPQLMYLNKK